eukprot:Selendium_serpulae@DN5269_c2_g1_i1.p2
MRGFHCLVATLTASMLAHASAPFLTVLFPLRFTVLRADAPQFNGLLARLRQLAAQPATLPSALDESDETAAQTLRMRGKVAVASEGDALEALAIRGRMIDLAAESSPLKPPRGGANEAASTSTRPPTETLPVTPPPTETLPVTPPPTETLPVTP